MQYNLIALAEVLPIVKNSLEGERPGPSMQAGLWSISVPHTKCGNMYLRG